MTYTQFAENMLIALYQESERGDPSPNGITFETLINRYGLPSNPRWTDRLADEWRNEGFADVSDELGPANNLQIEITGSGMRRVERVYGDKDGVGEILARVDAVPRNVLTTETGEPLVTEDGHYLVTEQPND